MIYRNEQHTQSQQRHEQLKKTDRLRCYYYGITLNTRTEKKLDFLNDGSYKLIWGGNKDEQKHVLGDKEAHSSYFQEFDLRWLTTVSLKHNCAR